MSAYLCKSRIYHIRLCSEPILSTLSMQLIFMMLYLLLMVKLGFKPEWTEQHTKDVEEFKKWYTGKEDALDSEDYEKWLHGVQQ